MLSQLTPAQQATLTGASFFPSLIADPFRDGLHTAFDFAIVMCLAGAAASWVRGKRVADPLLQSDCNETDYSVAVTEA